MMHQVLWKTEPGLRGLACSEFRTVPTSQPDTERGVALELATEAERDTLLAMLEQRFAAERFTNSAAAFETVKAFILEWAAQRQ